MDEKGLEFGDVLAKEIFQAIKQYNFIIAIMTGGYVRYLPLVPQGIILCCTAKTFQVKDNHSNAVGRCLTCTYARLILFSEVESIL